MAAVVPPFSTPVSTVNNGFNFLSIIDLSLLTPIEILSTAFVR